MNLKKTLSAYGAKLTWTESMPAWDFFVLLFLAGFAAKLGWAAAEFIVITLLLWMA
jgi:hypothetical protein